MLDMLPWLLLFFVPAVAMRTLAEDTRSGQLEVVLSQPITELAAAARQVPRRRVLPVDRPAATLPIPHRASRSGPSCRGARSWRSTSGRCCSRPGSRGSGVWASCIDPEPDHRVHRGGGGDVRAGAGRTQPAGGGSAAAARGRRGPARVCWPTSTAIGRGVIDLRDAVYFLSLAAIFLTLAYGSCWRASSPPGRRRSGGSGSACCCWWACWWW